MHPSVVRSATPAGLGSSLTQMKGRGLSYGLSPNLASPYRTFLLLQEPHHWVLLQISLKRQKLLMGDTWVA